MPNWCFTQYVADGPKDQLQRLYDTMKRLKEMPRPGLIENDFGSSWLGNLVAELNEGVVPHGFRCRGYYYGLELEDDILRFDTETAWWEADDTRHLIEDKFPGVKLYYCAEEFGCGAWGSNDVNHTYFDEQFYFSAEGYCGEDYMDGENYMDSLEDLISAVESTCGVTGLKTYEDCEQAVEAYEDCDGCGATIVRLTFDED